MINADFANAHSTDCEKALVPIHAKASTGASSELVAHA
jgi:hypothetical protein